MEYYSKKPRRKAPAHQVLCELCSQLDESDIFFERIDDPPMIKELSNESMESQEESPEAETDEEDENPIFPLRD